jgi:hypothetical protein
MARYHLWGLVAALVLSLVPASGPAHAQEELQARPSPRPNWSAESNRRLAQFGWSVASAGDVNGDGFADVIVGAPNYNNGTGEVGRAYVFHGSATGISRAANWTAEGSQENSDFGWSVATAGDVNGDGYDEVIVGEIYFGEEVGEEDVGRADLYYGSATGLSNVSGWSVVGDRRYGLVGSGVGTAGDVNGDGYDDVIVGAASYSDRERYEGAAFVYLGSATGLGTVAAWRADGPRRYASFGWAVGTAGDVNGDGYDDVIVGAGSYTNGQDYEGSAYVFHGSADGLSTSANWSAEGNRSGAYFGSSVGTAGDVNGDGYADVTAGAAGAGIVRAYAYYGSAAGLSPVADWIHKSDQPTSGFGFSVRTAGDVNEDGYDELIVGGPYYADGEDQEGGVWVFDGSASGLSTDFTGAAESNQASAWFGWSASTAGDINGDGRDDVIIGAMQYGHPQLWEGIAVAYYGEL